MTATTRRPGSRLDSPSVTTAPHDPLPAPVWARFPQVRIVLADGSEVAVDEIVVGPSGVHVVTTQLAGPNAAVNADSSRLRVREAQAAAAAVVAALPERYRPAVAAALVLADATSGGAVGAAGCVVDGVTVATEDVLVDAIRHKPLALSTSECAVVAAGLRATVRPTSASPERSRGLLRLWRRRREDHVPAA